MTGNGPRPLASEALTSRCDPASLAFETTAELDGPGGIVGQERASGQTLRTATRCRRSPRCSSWWAAR